MPTFVQSNTLDPAPALADASDRELSDAELDGVSGGEPALKFDFGLVQIRVGTDDNGDGYVCWTGPSSGGCVRDFK